MPSILVRREIDSRLLCRDGKWRHYVAGVEDFKYYKTMSRAVKYGLRREDGTAYLIPAGFHVDRFGRVFNDQGEYEYDGSANHHHTDQQHTHAPGNS